MGEVRPVSPSKRQCRREDFSVRVVVSVSGMSVILRALIEAQMAPKKGR